MSKALERINAFIDGIDTYEKQTGRKNPPAFISRETLLELKQALIKAEKEHKALEIIKKKQPLIVCLLDANTLEDYNCHVMSWNKLSEEEYKILKEVL